MTTARLQQGAMMPIPAGFVGRQRELRVLGDLAVARGQAAAAEAAFARAHACAAAVPMPFEHARLSLDDGRRQRAAGNRPLAVRGWSGPITRSPASGRTPTCGRAPRNWPPCR